MSNYIVTYRNKTNNEYIVWKIPYNIYNSPFFNANKFFIMESGIKLESNTQKMHYNNFIKNTTTKAFSLIDDLPF